MKHVVAAALVAFATPALAHPSPDVAACLEFADLGKAIAKARDAGYSDADVLNVLLESGLFEQSPRFTYRIVEEIFSLNATPEQIREAGFLGCMEALSDGD